MAQPTSAIARSHTIPQLFSYAELTRRVNPNYGARARAGGTCLVAVLHAASVIGCWGRAAVRVENTMNRVNTYDLGLLMNMNNTFLLLFIFMNTTIL